MNNETPSDTHDTLRCTRCLKDEIPDGASDDEIEGNKCVLKIGVLCEPMNPYE